MRLAIARDAESKQKCDFCDPILVLTETKSGVSISKAYELLGEKQSDPPHSGSRIVQGGRFESNRRKH
jgi:hypothetical protein